MIDSNILYTFINEPYNDMNNFNLGYEYDKIGQTAAAFSYYLRCAEYTSNDNLSYECFIRMSKCLSKQGHREFKELTCLEHAVSIRPDHPVAYYIMSLYHSFRCNWLKSYMYACIGLKCIDLKDSKNNLIKDIGYFNKYQLLFQKAYSGYNKGKIKESQTIYYDLLENYKLDENLRDIILNNLTNYKTPNSQPIIYTKDKYDLLKYKFTTSENIKKNYSQIYQDLFVLSMTDGKMGGSYLEIGSGDPIYGNNTYLLEQNYNWSGISIDINQESYRIFNEKRRNKCICEDALKINYKTLLKGYTEIDYLQLDCDPPVITYLILLKIPFDKIKFGVITYEHDYYNDVTESYREKSRDYLKKMGYKMIVGNISPNNNNMPFEDWWIHPKLIDESIYNKFIYKDIEYINGEDYMLYPKLLNHLSVINKNLPELIVIDNFYKDPDSIRKKALDLEFLSENYHGAVGFRCERGRLLSDEAKDYFEKILGKKIKMGNNIGEWSYSTNGCFQWCSKDTRIVYHSDSQEYAGIVFLTPEAPVNCGTSIFRHKKYKIKDNSIWSKSDWSDGNIMNDPHLDKNLWEEVDRIGNIYNRLVLFKSHNVHGVSEYFGETINDSRLFQLFFFDIE
tara:strand:+ start:619 stop:2478 length:1860 start_codon:yes stop_codon:yes gene_type:complete